jgi:hypothetical protein
VANCFATDQSSAFVEASLGDCCCQRQSIRNQSRQCRHPIRVRIAAVSSISVAYPKQIQSESKVDTSKGLEQIAVVSSVLVAYPKRIQSKYVKRMGTNRLGFQAYWLRIQSKSKANTSKGWEQIDCSSKRIGCISKANQRYVVEAQDRQTDRLRFE